MTLAPEEDQALDQKALDMLLKESSELATRNRARPELERSESLEPPPRRNQPAKTIPSGSPSGRQSDRATRTDVPPDHSQAAISRFTARSRSRSRRNYRSRRNSSIRSSRQTSTDRSRSHGRHQGRREHERGIVTGASGEVAHDVPTILRRRQSRERDSNHAQRKRQTFGRHDSSGRTDRRSLSSSPDPSKHHRSYRQRSTSPMSIGGGGKYRERRRGASREVSRSRRTQASWGGRERYDSDRHRYRGRDSGGYDPMDIDRFERWSPRRGSSGWEGFRRPDHHLGVCRNDDNDNRGRLTTRRNDEREREQERERERGRGREHERSAPHRQRRDMNRERHSRSRSPRFR